MRTATATIRGLSHFSYSAFIGLDKLDREGPDDYEKRTWRHRAHADTDGKLFIPPMAFKKSLDAAARFRGEKIKGRGHSTYAKIFVSGVLVLEPMRLALTRATVDGEWLFVPSDGKPGGGSRVMKCFPVVPAGQWGGAVAFTILNDATITEAVFERTLIDAGNFIGVGRFRPERGGFYGRFAVDGIEWT